ncbi:hypothetical protein [Noviherbaspirillum denitrificans]|uniref:Uncharacterized protein n=1 Tax=Noviherbaspirillum denitrificans TaxID=1968433 RepID=A0A254T9Z5_9BURK|nr:hypothetical protein [Noviherbaspirillum denitrificans]OWW19490.1 hypothetical protein AYR66_08175 [Noviherbaspirillum denitrificans]
MNVTTEFKRAYADALRNMHLNESEVERYAERLASTEGMAPDLLAEAHFEKIISERNARVEKKARTTLRNLICGAGMVVPVSAIASAALLFLYVTR